MTKLRNKRTGKTVEVRKKSKVPRKPPLKKIRDAIKSRRTRRRFAKK